MEILSVEKLVKSYVSGDFQLKIDNFSVQKGSITGLIGPNGAGKTTLLKLIVKLLFPTQGHISLMGQHINEKNIIENISYMPGQKNFYENMTIKQMLTLASHSVPHWNKLKADNLLTRFPLPIDKKISTLSYGERTQLSAILTFSKDVPMIILDEPTQGLDPVMQERMLSLIKAESSDNKTILFSSHQLNEVEATADSIAIIKSGQLIISDNIDDLKATLFMIVTNKSMDTDDLDILAVRKEGDKNIIISRKNKTSLDAKYSSMEVNLKDIFLNIIEGEVGR